MNKSQALLDDEYWLVYNSAIDSINSWIDNKIGNFAYWHSLINYQLDSVLCVNKEQNKIIMSILLPYIGEKGTGDQIEYFYGVKIDNQWYFFCGPTLVLPREFYQEDIHTPLSFEKLKQIATYNVYRGYLKKNEQGEWVINDKFFEYHFKGSGWGCGHLNEKGQWVDTCSDKQFEQLYLNNAESVWKK